MHGWLTFIARLPVQVLSRLRQHAWLTFGLMGVCFLGFGICSLNLIMLLQANLDLFLEYGWQVAQEGALRQLLELLVLSYVALACWVGFKCCEKLLVDRLTRDPRRNCDAG
ncbi:hypothetical protein [Chitinimonas sp. BJB300]|uniref:hypothetical protein n=1 Tax=Chitinimonas sp. BJB300 TaxID=1559339 RepID=UPI000C0F596D|nr:hypothetical protein [Chitinimonas sp. BJB300]PHV12951.1 hypothetical protein CSQ89_02970 [Chitinimonas sp. BJB300]TSJ89096.1 hypothetical protein FG002_009490 [Chitinimonas sp. BJB300]